MPAAQSEELEIARRKLAEGDKMASLGRLLATVVHEINTPMGCLVSNNEVALRSLAELKRVLDGAEPALKSPPREALEILETLSGLAAVDKLACERISALVRSLRNFSRTGERTLGKANVNELIEDALKLAGAAVRQRITVEKEYGILPEIECYPQLLSQVFLNLLVNAGQAIPGQGWIRVRTEREGDCVHVSIADSGSGITPEDRPRIFSPGFTTKPADQGTGLGLAITRDIVVDNHGGEIDFESQPGAGATFHVRIPVAQARKNGN